MAQKRIRGKTRTDLLSRYRTRIETARRWRSGEGYDHLWKRCVDLYRGKHFDPATLGKQDRIAVNITFGMINVMVPSTSVNDPKLVVLAQRNEDSEKAPTVESALNYWWRRYDFQPEVALAVKDALTIGHGWLKVGWRFVEEVKDEEREFETASGPDGTDASKTPEDPSESPAGDESSSSTDSEPEFEVTQDRPFAERVSWRDILVDPDAKTLGQAKWIAQKSVVPLAQLRQDERYRLKGRNAAIPDCHQAGSDDDKELSDDIQRVTVWEFYDMQLGTMCAFPENGSELLLDPEKQPFDFGHPFVMLRNYEVPDEFYPMGDIEALEPLQEELNKTRSQLMNQRRTYDRKWVFRRDAFDNQGIAQLQSNKDNVMVPTNENDAPLNDLIVPLPINPPNPQLFQYAEGIQQDFDKISGVSEFEQGQTSDVRHTATEASMINDAANSRAADKLRSIEKFMGKVAERVIMLAQQYLTQDQEARVLGPNGHHVWVPFGREQVKGDFDFSVEAGSTKPLNESQRRSQALQMLQTFTPYASAGLINVQELIRYTLVIGFGVKEPDKFLMGAAPQQPSEAHKSPKQTLIESLNYKDAPPDIQRQIEQAAGFQPSQVGGSSPAEQGLTSAMGPHIQQAAQAPQQAQQGQQQQAQGMQQMLMEAAKQQAAQTQLHAKHAHEASMAHEDRKHDHVQAAVGHAQSIEQGAVQHGQAMEQQAQQGDQQMMQQVMGQAMQPEPESTATEE